MTAAEGAEIISVEPLMPVDQNQWPMPSPDWQRASLNATFDAIRYHRPDLRLTHLERTSVDACREFEGVASSIYIDGDHNYAEVLADIQGWKTKLADGGILAGHDYWPTDQGVIEAVHASGLGFEAIPNTRIFRLT
jgi:hypothetical protein